MLVRLQCHLFICRTLKKVALYLYASSVVKGKGVLPSLALNILRIVICIQWKLISVCFSYRCSGLRIHFNAIYWLDLEFEFKYFDPSLGTFFLFCYPTSSVCVITNP